MNQMYNKYQRYQREFERLANSHSSDAAEVVVKLAGRVAQYTGASPEELLAELAPATALTVAEVCKIHPDKLAAIGTSFHQRIRESVAWRQHRVLQEVGEAFVELAVLGVEAQDLGADVGAHIGDARQRLHDALEVMREAFGAPPEKKSPTT